MPKTYTVKQVADILGFSTNSIYTFLKEKRIKGVRIGRGRFRIPEQELARILHLSKKQQSADVTPPPVSLEESVQTEAAANEQNEQVVSVRAGDVLCPNIFDWFVGLAAIISGISLFLFNSSVMRPEMLSFSRVVFAVRLILIAAGIGVVASAILMSAKGWHRVFHGLLAILGALNATVLFRSGDVDGAILYGAMSVVLIIGMFVHTQGIMSLGVYLSILAGAFPLWIFAFADSPAVRTAAQVVGMSAQWFGVAVSGMSVAFLVLFWVGYGGIRVPLIIAGTLAGLLCFGGAIWYGELQYWSRAFFLIVLGFFIGVTPYWQWLCDVTPKRQRLLLHGLLGGVGAMLLAAVLVVYLLQQNMWGQSKAEFFNRITAAQNLLTSAVDSAQSAALVTAANHEVATALATADTEALVHASKLLYESNPIVRRVVFLDAEGNGVGLYPYGTFDQPNYAFRDYFIQARDTKSAYVSDVFQTAADQTRRYVTVISVPMFTAKGTFVGVMAISLDLERIGLKLRQLAVETRGEYFIILDRDKTILSHPDGSWIGKALPENDILYTTDAIQGVVGGVLPNGVLGLVAYGRIDTLGWTVTLRAPVTAIYGLTSNAAIWVFATVVTAMITGVLLAFFLKLRWLGQSGGGP